MAKKKKLIKRVETTETKSTEVGTEPADEFEVLDMEPVEEPQKPAEPPAEEPQVVEGQSDVVVEMEDIEEQKPRVVQEPPNPGVRDVSEEGVGSRDLEILGAGDGHDAKKPPPGPVEGDSEPPVLEVPQVAPGPIPIKDAWEKKPPEEQPPVEEIAPQAPTVEEDIPELLDMDKREQRVIMREEEVRLKEESLARKLDEITMKIKELDDEVKEKLRLEYRVKRREEELQNRMEKLNTLETDLRDKLRRSSEFEKHLKAQAEELIKRSVEIKTNEERHHKELMSFEKQRDEFENWRRDQVGIEHRLKLMEQDLEKDRAIITAKQEEAQKALSDIRFKEQEIKTAGGDLTLKSEKLDQLRKQEQDLTSWNEKLATEEQRLKGEQERLSSEDEDLSNRREELTRIAAALKRKEDELKDLEVMLLEKDKAQQAKGIPDIQAPVQEPTAGPKGDISVGGPSWASTPGSTPDRPAWDSGSEEVLQVDEETPAVAPPPVRPPPVPVVIPPPKPVTPPEAKPLKKIRCTSCKAIIPIYTEQRPLDIQCPSCGKKGRLLK
jgi:hypothetical protein